MYTKLTPSVQSAGKTIRLLITILLTFMTLGLGLTSIVNAATITVAAGEVAVSNNGTCSLREAIINANNGAQTHADCDSGSAGADTINLTAGTYSLTDVYESDPDGYGPVGLPSITSDITLVGTSPATTITRGSGTFRLFHVKSGASLTLQNLALSNGLAQGGNGGSGWNGGAGGALGAGGAVYNRGMLTLTGVTLNSNQAAGGNGGNDNPSAFGAGGGGGMGGDGGNSDGTNGGGGGGVNGGAGGGAGPGNNATGTGGGGGGAGYQGADGFANGGNGGFGGGGGGGSCLSVCPSSAANGGTGGFGGGGGGHDYGTSATGFGGGSGSLYNGGGGAGMGGAVFNDQGTVTIENSTFSGNVALGGNGGGGSGNGGSGYGGALFNYNGTVTVINTTFASNSVTAGTGGSAGSAAGGGIYNYQDTGTATLTIQNTILADTPSSKTDCENNSGTVTAPASNRNLIENNSGCGTPTVTSDPKLLALDSNGGPTQTHALADSSPALEQIPLNTNGCGDTYTTDQRGAARPGSKNATNKCEMGAWEAQSLDPTAITLSSFGAQDSGTPLMAGMALLGLFLVGGVAVVRRKRA